MPLATVDCKWCSQPTYDVKTHQCPHCWALCRAIEKQPLWVTKKIVEAIEHEAAAIKAGVL